MVTVGGEISGYCAIGGTFAAIKPASTNRIEMTPAKMGRSMKNFDISDSFYFDGAADFAPLVSGAFPPATAGAAAGAAAEGVTGAPGRTLSRLSTITRSPALSPDRIVQFDPAHSPTCTGRSAALFSASTTKTR